jgi:hypothetical protein
MGFKILGEIREKQVIAAGRSIRILPRLVRLYGQGNWLKMKGIAKVQFEDGTLAEAEVHWFEAEGIGRRKMKIKWLLY